MRVSRTKPRKGNLPKNSEDISNMSRSMLLFLSDKDKVTETSVHYRCQKDQVELLKKVTVAFFKNEVFLVEFVKACTDPLEVEYKVFGVLPKITLPRVYLSTLRPSACALLSSGVTCHGPIKSRGPVVCDIDSPLPSLYDFRIVPQWKLG